MSPQPHRPGTVPLERAFSKLGLASRTQARTWILDGRVTVDGRRVADPEAAVVPERVRLQLDGLALGASAWKTVLLHKPRGVLTSRTDPDGRPTVYDLLSRPQPIHGSAPKSSALSQATRPASDADISTLVLEQPQIARSDQDSAALTADTGQPETSDASGRERREWTPTQKSQLASLDALETAAPNAQPDKAPLRETRNPRSGPTIRRPGSHLIDSETRSPRSRTEMQSPGNNPRDSGRLLPPLEHLGPVGRLDFATSGLLLLTNDTRLASWLTDPRNAIPRVYAVTVRGLLQDTAPLLQGLVVDGERLSASGATVRKASRRETHLLLELVEGKNREIRRLLQALGHEVTRLKRIAFGGLELGDLEPGAWREVPAAEVLAVFPQAPLRVPGRIAEDSP